MRLQEQPELTDTFNLETMKSLQDAVDRIPAFLGMAVCDASGKVPDDATRHTLLLSVRGSRGGTRGRGSKKQEGVGGTAFCARFLSPSLLFCFPLLLCGFAFAPVDLFFCFLVFLCLLFGCLVIAGAGCVCR